MLIKGTDVLEILGKNLKKARKKLKYTQEFVAEGVDISIDLLRNIENGRNIGSVPTLLNLCNFLKISPNTLFAELLDFKEDTLEHRKERDIIKNNYCLRNNIPLVRIPYWKKKDISLEMLLGNEYLIDRKGLT